MIQRRACHGLRVLRTCIKGDCWGIEKCEYLSHMLLSSNVLALEDTLQDLLAEVWHSAFYKDDIHGLKRYIHRQNFQLFQNPFSVKIMFFLFVCLSDWKGC